MMHVLVFIPYYCKEQYPVCVPRVIIVFSAVHDKTTCQIIILFFIFFPLDQYLIFCYLSL